MFWEHLGRLSVDVHVVSIALRGANCAQHSMSPCILHFPPGILPCLTHPTLLQGVQV